MGKKSARTIVEKYYTRLSFSILSKVCKNLDASRSAALSLGLSFDISSKADETAFKAIETLCSMSSSFWTRASTDWWLDAIFFGFFFFCYFVSKNDCKFDLRL